MNSRGDELTKLGMNWFEKGVELTARGSEHSTPTASSTAATDRSSLITESSSSEVGEQPMNYCPVDINPASKKRPRRLSGGLPYLKGIGCNPCLGITWVRQ